MTIEMYEYVMNHLQIDKYRELIIEQDQKITELEKACEETQELLDKQIEATYRLDKENTELKHTIATLRQEKDNVSMHAKAMEVVAKTRSEQLTKARGLLRAWFQYCIDTKGKTPLQIETAQFLKDSEVEK